MKYAPAREDGLKPYVVTVWTMGREGDDLVWAESTSRARSEAGGRRTAGRYAKSARRALDGGEEET